MNQLATDEAGSRHVDDGLDGPGTTGLGPVLAGAAVVLGVVALVSIVMLFGADGPVARWRWVLAVGPLLGALVALAAWQRQSGMMPWRAWPVRRGGADDTGPEH